MGFGGVGRPLPTTYKLWVLGLVIYILRASVSPPVKWEKRHMKSGLLGKRLRLYAQSS